MTDFLERTQTESNVEQPATFNNPLTIVLGEGKVAMQCLQTFDGNGIVFGLHGASGEIGSKGESIIGDSLQPNQVFLMCRNEASAKILRDMAERVLNSFTVIDHGEIPQSALQGLEFVPAIHGEQSSGDNCPLIQNSDVSEIEKT